MRVVDRVEDLLSLVGAELGPTPAVLVDQRTIDLFADATGDHQWIHVDPVRAADGPYGTTIAHGYLTLALAGTFVPLLLEVRDASSVINYGADRLRFLSPVRVGSSVSARAVLSAAREVAGGVQVTLDLTVDVEGSRTPACAVSSLLRYLA